MSHVQGKQSTTEELNNTPDNFERAKQAKLIYSPPGFVIQINIRGTQFGNGNFSSLLFSSPLLFSISLAVVLCLSLCVSPL